VSQLYLTDSGHVIPTLSEELTTYRRARKILHLPGTTHPGTLYVLARAYAGTESPLRVSVNGFELAAIETGDHQAFRWYALSVAPALLKAGANVIELWSDSAAMDAWSLGIEGGQRQPESFVSDDSGGTWRNEKMGYLNVLEGEYMVRLRLTEGEDPPPPAMVWENPDNPRLHHLLGRIPAEAARPGPRMARVRALSTWLSQSWQHIDARIGAQFAPWDAETILAWGRARVGQDGRLPVVMCVHYGAAFVSCCAALGIPARCAVFAGSHDGSDGHFTAEVWFDEYQKWAFVDPNADALFCREGVPLSVSEIQALGPDLGRFAVWGAGSEFQRRYPPILSFVNNNYLRGQFIKHRSLWARTDFFSHPELTPPAHGATAYSETNLVWEQRDREAGFGMFPYFGGSDYFEAAPGW
jgi:hypothetical protein